MPETIIDYYPLTRAEVAYLLQAAWSSYHGHSGSIYDVSSIQIRLGQGIEGSTCPSRTGTPADTAEARMDSHFMDWLRSGEPFDDKIINEMCGIIGISNTITTGWTIEDDGTVRGEERG